MWRPLLVIAGALFAQVAPAAACAIFDGPGKLGCPAAFANFSTHHSTKDPDGQKGDCSEGPSYLSLDDELKPAPTHSHDADSTPPLDNAVARGEVIESVAPRDKCLESGGCPSDRGRFLYLSTLRLRI